MSTCYVRQISGPRLATTLGITVECSCTFVFVWGTFCSRKKRSLLYNWTGPENGLQTGVLWNLRNVLENIQGMDCEKAKLYVHDRYCFKVLL